MNIKRKLLLILLTLLILIISVFGCNQSAKKVVVYTSVDQVYSEKIFKLFEQQTGIKVSPVYDIEASKTVGLVNRLIAEKDNPRADVFWNGEILQTLRLKENDVLEKADIASAKELPASFVDKDGYWYGFGGRARILLVNKTMITPENYPKTMCEFSYSQYVKQIGIANPMFGTTSTQAAALYAFWGESKARDYYLAIKNNGITVLEGNSVVKDYVSGKKIIMGMTDTDDAISELKQNSDLEIVFLDQGENDMGTLVIPNSVAVIKGSKNPSEADAFLEFLLSKSTEQQLVDDDWINIPVHTGVTPSKEITAENIKIMQVDFNEVFKVLEKSQNDMKEIYVG